jgi:hypothetical protein
MKLKIWKLILVEIKKIYKFENLIELEISLINEIRGLIEEIPNFEADSGPNCYKLKFNDQNQ